MEPTYALAKGILKPWLRTWFDWSIEGMENIPKSGAAILAFNHIAYLDPFTAAYPVDEAGRRPRFLAKAELFDDKRIAWVLKGARQIPVARGTRSAPVDSILFPRPRRGRGKERILREFSLDAP